MIPDPENTTVIKLDRKAFRYDDVLTDWGWTHEIFYDIKSQMFYIADFPEDGKMFETSICPDIGPATIQAHGKTYNIKIYE